MQLKNGNLVSGGGDCQSKNKVHRMEIKNWIIIIFFLFKVLREHESDVNCIIQFNDDRIASGTKDRKIRIWKIDNVEENVKKFYIMEEVLTDYPRRMYCLIQLKDVF